MAYVSTKIFLKKSKEKKRSQSLADSGDKTSSSCRFLRPHYEISFPYTICFTLNSKMSRNMCKLHHKVRNGQNLPHICQNFRKYFSKSNLRTSLAIFQQVWDHNTKTVCPKTFFVLFSTLSPECLGTCVFGVINCVMAKRASVQLLHCQMKLDVSSLEKGGMTLASPKARVTSEVSLEWQTNIRLTTQIYSLPDLF